MRKVIKCTCCIRYPKSVIQHVTTEYQVSKEGKLILGTKDASHKKVTAKCRCGYTWTFKSMKTAIESFEAEPERPMQEMTISERLDAIEDKVSPMFQTWTYGKRKETDTEIREHLTVIRKHIEEQAAVIDTLKDIYPDVHFYVTGLTEVRLNKKIKAAIEKAEATND